MRISYEDLQDPIEGMVMGWRNVSKLLNEHGATRKSIEEFMAECKRLDKGRWHSSDVMNWLGY